MSRAGAAVADSGGASRRRAGQPTKLRPDLRDRLLATVRSGAYLKSACGSVGISYTTLRGWIRRAEAEIEAAEEEEREISEAEQVYVEFFYAYTRARAEAELRNVAVIQKAAAGYPVVRITRKVLRENGVVTEEVEETVTTIEFDWRASAWFLERGGFEGRWRREQKIEHDGQVAGGVLIVPSTADPEAWAAAAAAQQAELQKRMRISGGGGDT